MWCRLADSSPRVFLAIDLFLLHTLIKSLSPVNVTLLQTDIRWADAGHNICQAAQLLDSHPHSDLYVLPEMWSTGFATEPHGIAADEAGSTALAWMQQEALSRQCALSGSLAVRLADGTFRNRHYFVDGRSGQTYFYDKHHLFSYGHEDRYYTPGQEHTIVHYCGFRLLLLTCYDLRFPLWMRYSDKLQYIVMDLTAVEEASLEEKEQGLVEWADAFRADSWDSAKRIENEGVKEAMKTMSMIMATPSERDLIWDRRMAIWDYNSSLSGAKKAGREEGRKEGMKAGMKAGVKAENKRLNSLISRLLDENRIEDIKRSTVDPEFQDKLYRELFTEESE